MWMFLSGFTVGGLFGIIAMCLLQAHRLYKYDMEDRE